MILQNRQRLGLGLGILIGCLLTCVIGSWTTGIPIANAQFGDRRSNGKAVYMIAKTSALQAAAQGPAAALMDPDFYVLYEDGTIRKGKITGF